MHPLPTLLALIAAIAGAVEREEWVLDTGSAAERPAAAIAFLPTALADPARCGVSASAQGRPLRSRLLWAAPGEPVQVLLEGGARGEVRLLLGADQPREEEWWPRAGVRCTVRARTGGGPPDNAERMQAIFAAGALQGRVLLDRIFQGVNPCAPGGDVAMEFEAWLRLPRTGDWRFHTVSSDASAVWVDDHLVVAWPGWHGLDGGRKGEHAGELRLEAGLHRIRYLLVQRGRFVCAALAWTPPGGGAPTMIPAEAFEPVARWPARPAAAGPWFTWEPTASARWGERVLIETRFTAHGTIGQPRWRFDDGLPAASGTTIARLTARPGLRSVVLEADGRHCERHVSVRERFSLGGEWDDSTLANRFAVLTADGGRLADADLAALVRLLVAADEQARLPALIEPLRRRATAGEDVAEALWEAGQALQGPPLRRDREAAALWRDLLDHRTIHDARRERTILHLAGLELHRLGDATLAGVLLASLDERPLAADDRRLATIYRGDAALVAGEVEVARAAYRAAGTRGDERDRKAEIRRRQRLEGLREHLARDEGEDAARLLRDIEWERPEERLGAETAVLWARTHLLRHDPLPAVIRLRALIAVLPQDEAQAEALWLLGQALDAAGDRAGADAARAALHRDHPYSPWATRR